MEAKLEAKLRTKVKALGGLALKFTSPGIRGVPDRIVLMPGGSLYFAELKNPSGNKGLSPQQIVVHRLLKALGFNVYTISTYEQLDDFLNAIRNLR